MSALVLDVGTSSTRLGYAGEDSPRCVVPTSYGYTPKTLKSTSADGMEIDVPSRDTFVGETGAPRWRAGMEVGNPMTDGLSAYTPGTTLSGPHGTSYCSI